MCLLQAERSGLRVDADAKVVVAGNQQSATGGGDAQEDIVKTEDNQESWDRVEPPPKW